MRNECVHVMNVFCIKINCKIANKHFGFENFGFKGTELVHSYIIDTFSIFPFLRTWRFKFFENLRVYLPIFVTLRHDSLHKDKNQSYSSVLASVISKLGVDKLSGGPLWRFTEEVY